MTVPEIKTGIETVTIETEEEIDLLIMVGELITEVNNNVEKLIEGVIERSQILKNVMVEEIEIVNGLQEADQDHLVDHILSVQEVDSRGTRMNREVGLLQETTEEIRIGVDQDLDLQRDLANLEAKTLI